MRRQDLAHILRAACEVSQDPEIVVLGSQAILGAYDEDDLPALATASVEADLAWLADGPDRERAERVNGSIGERRTSTTRSATTARASRSRPRCYRRAGSRG